MISRNTSIVIGLIASMYDYLHRLHLHKSTYEHNDIIFIAYLPTSETFNERDLPLNYDS